MEGKNITEKASKDMVILLIISLIPFILTAFNLVNQEFIIIVLFAIEFLIVGISTTSIIYPLLNFKDLTRKIILIVPFSIIFTLISVIITLNFLKPTISNVIMLLSIISIIFTLISLSRKGSNDKNNEKNESNKDTRPTDVDNSIGIKEPSTKSRYVVLLLCIIALVGMLVPPFNILPLWQGLCIPFILFIPGFYLISAIVPEKNDILTSERVGIGIFTSLIITSVIGLILFEVEGKLNMLHTSIILVIISLIIIISYLYRNRKINSKNRLNYSRLNKILIIITIIALIGVVGSGIYVTTHNVNQGNTTFVVNGIQKTANPNGYYNFTNGENLTTELNITNNQHKDMNYTVRVEVHNNSTNRVLSENKISLKEGQSTTIPSSITMSPGEKDIQYILYDNENKPYIIRHLYANVTSDDNEYYE